ncbi:MAG: two-component system phosphate regulon sensor histidine kinase PhoR [Bradymonadia bacterium]
MKLGVRAKLLTVSVALILTAGAPTAAYLESQLRDWMESRIEGELGRHAATARTLLEASPSRSIEIVDGLADRLGDSMLARVTVIAADGTVLGDSQVDLANVPLLENHGGRPEVQAAVTADLGLSRRFSTTLRSEMLYVAVPFGEFEGRGVVRVAVGLDEVDHAVGKLRTILFAGILVGLFTSLVMSALASHLLSRTLLELVANARAMAAGNRAQPIAVSGDELLGGIALSLNQMAGELESSVADLAAERDRIEAVLEGMSEAVVAVDSRRRVILVNSAARALFEHSRDPAGCSLSELVRVPVLHELLEERHAGVEECEFDLIGSQTRRVLANVTSQRVHGGAVIVLRDVTRIRHLETVRRDFVANVSHELRTPVSVIKATAETLVDGAINDPIHGPRFMDAIQRNADRLARIITDLLSLASFESGQLVPEMKSLKLDAAVRECVESLDKAAVENGTVMHCEVPPELVVRVDADALEHIVLNLVENALKYTPPGGRVQVRALKTGDWVRVEVQDNGMGIPPEHRDRVFERFYRIDAGRSRAVGGTGLGLSIVKHQVESMGGEVGVEPAQPHGAKFWFTVPAA